MSWLSKLAIILVSSHSNLSFLVSLRSLILQTGASILSRPIRFSLDDRLVTSASHSKHAGVIGGIIAGIVAITLAIVALMLIKKRKLRQKTVGNNGVAFENPSYLREIHMDRVQVTDCRSLSLTKTFTFLLCLPDHPNNCTSH